MHERTVQMLTPRRKFFARLLRNLLMGIFLIMLALFVGMWGYHHFEKMSWVDAYVNASMILSGMGPVSTLNTNEGKIFAGTYALFSGLFFILIVGLVFAPLIHRFFQKINLADMIEGKRK